MSLNTKSEEYQLHLTSCHSSGLSVKSYSKRHGLKYDTFLYYYRKRYPVKESTDKLLPVRLKSEGISEGILCRIELRTGHVLHVRNAELLYSLLPVLLS